MPEAFLIGGLSAVMGLVLVLPFSVHRVEEELEAFLLVMGCLAVTMGGLWSRHLLVEALTEPARISAAVFIFGLGFRWLRDPIRRHVSWLAARLGPRAFLALLVAGLGLLSSVITAIIAALVLAEVVSGLRMEKSRERAIVVFACYSIGLGAALTPLGEPLSTIATAKLSGPPHHADFFFLARLLWPWLLGGIGVLALLAAGAAGPRVGAAESLTEDKPEDLGTIAVRGVKVYAFVAALVLLGRGLSPLVDRFLSNAPAAALFWVNIVSAVLDNATLAAAEISPRMDAEKIRVVLLGLLVSGGMLIPGNIPNIISAGKLGIKSRDWARIGLPLGAVFMVVYFILLQASASWRTG